MTILIQDARQNSWLSYRTIGWLSKKLDVDYNILLDIIKKAKNPSPLEPLYRTEIVRRKGKKREIQVPNGDLMEIQRKINKRILAKLPKDENAFGFSGGSIVDAISVHLKTRRALSIWTCDIKDAFPSMFQERIFSVLKSHFSPSASCLLTFLTTLPSGRLPQGAPTSPRIFDLCMKASDREFSEIAESRKGKYSRYADNLFFSGKKECLQEIEKEVFAWFQMAELTLHKVKVKDLQNQTAARTLGLNVVKRKICNTRRFERNLRLSIHHTNWLLNNGKRDTPEFAKAWQKLRGQMNFARKDTLPEKLLNSYLELEKRLEESSV